jgi:hypothetical protein
VSDEATLIRARLKTPRAAAIARQPLFGSPDYRPFTVSGFRSELEDHFFAISPT